MEEPTSQTKLGGSLPVPFVQELAKEINNNNNNNNNNDTVLVPKRYVRLDQDPPFTTQVSASLVVPVIDLKSLLSPQNLVAESELENLHLACKDWGFFQLINHGVSQTLVEDVKRGVQEFFNMPMEEKEKYFQEANDMEGLGHAFVVSDEQKLDWGDMFFMTTLPEYLRKPHLFPKFPLPLREHLEAYTTELEIVAKNIIDCMAKALGMEAKEMREMIGEGWQAVRMNYYPPCPNPELVIGLNPHSDGIGLAILLHINEVEGLQIKKDGTWVPIKPLPNAFVVNIGDMLEIMTNGIYRSIEHRATVNAKEDRLSMATFYSPSMGSEFGPAPSLVTPDRPAMFERVSVVDFMKGYFSRELRGKSYVEVLRIGNEEGQ